MMPAVNPDFKTHLADSASEGRANELKNSHKVIIGE